MSSTYLTNEQSKRVKSLRYVKWYTIGTIWMIDSQNDFRGAYKISCRLVGGTSIKANELERIIAHSRIVVPLSLSLSFSIFLLLDTWSWLKLLIWLLLHLHSRCWKSFDGNWKEQFCNNNHFTKIKIFEILLKKFKKNENDENLSW